MINVKDKPSTCRKQAIAGFVIDSDTLQFPPGKWVLKHEFEDKGEKR